MKPTTDEVLAWSLEAELGEKNQYGIWLNEGYWDKQIEWFAAIAYAAGAAAMKERAAKVCESLVKDRPDVIDVTSDLVASTCAAAIRALGDDDE